VHRISHAPWLPFSAPDAKGLRGLSVGISIALWNYIGWDNASTVEGEVHDAGRTYPRALAFALPLVTVGYFIPLLASLGSTDWRTWQDGGWPEIVRAAVGGGGFGAFVAVWAALAGMISALALFNALLLSYSRIPFVMAQDRLLPRAFTTTDARGTPTRAVLVSAVAYSVFVLVPLGRLVVADVVLYALALGLEFLALIQLRRTEPELRGAFRIPVPRSGVIALASLPIVILVTLVGLSFRDPDFGFPAICAAAVAVALGPILFGIARRRALAQAEVPRPASYSG